MKKEYVLVGGYPDKEKLKDIHPGGQVTATTLLVEYAKEKGIGLNIIDTTRGVFPPPTFKEKVYESKRRIGKLRALLNDKNIDGVIIFSASGFSFYEKILMAFFVKIKKIKTLFFIRSGHFLDLNHNSSSLRLLNRVLLKIPTYLGAQGQRWVNFYDDMGLETSNIKLIPNWIKVNNHVEHHKSNNKIVFLYVGWLVEKKGVKDLFDVIEKHEDLKPYTFRFIGGGSLLDELKERKVQKGLENVELVGWMDPEDITKEYQNGDVLILPSYAEGFPNVVLEALNNELPIISTNVGSITDSVMHNYNGFIFEPQDQVKLYEHIKKLALSAPLRDQFASNGKKVLQERHAFDQNCQKVFDLFN